MSSVKAKRRQFWWIRHLIQQPSDIVNLIVGYAEEPSTPPLRMYRRFKRDVGYVVIPRNLQLNIQWCDACWWGVWPFSCSKVFSLVTEDGRCFPRELPSMSEKQLGDLLDRTYRLCVVCSQRLGLGVGFKQFVCPIGDEQPFDWPQPTSNGKIAIAALKRHLRRHPVSPSNYFPLRPKIGAAFR